MLQQMSREAVPQRVRRNVFDTDVFSVTLDHGPRKLSRERPSTMQKNIWRRRFSITRFHRRVLLQPVNRTLAERHTSLFVSLAVTHNESRQQIDIVLFQTDELRDAQARSVHDFEYRTIAYSLFSRDIRRGKQAIDFVLGEKLRQVTEALWRIEIYSRVRLDMT